MLAHAQDTAFWPAEEWVKAAPGEEGMEGETLEKALDSARDRNATAVIVIRHGRVVAQRYWSDRTPTTTESVDALLQSFMAVLVGAALEDQSLTADLKASTLFAEWKGSPREGISLRHILTMTSGLRDARPREERRDRPLGDEQILALALQGAPGSAWRRLGATSLLLAAFLRRATNQTLENYAREKLFAPLGMKRTHLRSHRSGPEGERLRLESNAADLARLGLLVLRLGLWNGERIVPHDYMLALSKPSQPHNKAFGYLWWCNAQTRPTKGRRPKKKAMLFPDAPRDAVAALGRGERRIYVVPSLSIVAVRLGGRVTPSPEKRLPSGVFDNRFLAMVCRAVKTWKGPTPTPAPPTTTPGEEALLAKISELHHARRLSDIPTFRRVAEEIRQIWEELPPDVRDRIETQYPGIGDRIAKGFE
jgi:CubicO group peptidase (beta-lactamase class C family)